MRRLYALVIMVSSFTLLYLSIYRPWIFNLDSFISVQGKIVILVSITIFAIVLVAYLRILYRTNRNISKNDVAIFKVKPMLRELKEEELKDAFKELNAFLLYLRNKGYEHALTFLSSKDKPVEVILLIKLPPERKVSADNFSKIIATDFKISCKKWNISIVGYKDTLTNLVKNILFNTTSKAIHHDFLLNMYFALPYDLDLSANFNVIDFKHDRIIVKDDAKIKLGIVEGTEKELVLTLDDINKHVLILGSTGLGKTTTSSILTLELIRHNIPVLIIDWHDEYFNLLLKLGLSHNAVKVYNVNNPYPLDPFAAKNSESLDEKISYIVDILESTLNLTPPQSYYLYEVLYEECKKGYSEMSFNVLFEKLKSYNDIIEGYSGREARFALLRKIRLLTIGQAKKLFKIQDSKNTKLVRKPVTIIELGRIKNNTLRRTYTLFLLKELFSTYTEKGLSSNLKLAVVLDEFHNLINNQPCNVLERLFSEIRKFGVGLIVVSQTVAGLPNFVLRNANTKIIHSIKTFQDLKELINIIPYGPKFQDVILNLSVGEALVYKVSMQYPVKVSIKLPCI